MKNCLPTYTLLLKGSTILYLFNFPILFSENVWIFLSKFPLLGNVVGGVFCVRRSLIKLSSPIKIIDQENSKLILSLKHFCQTSQSSVMSNKLKETIFLIFIFIWHIYFCMVIVYQSPEVAHFCLKFPSILLDRKWFNDCS